MAEGKKTEDAKSGGIFEGLSISQIVAAALAAVTSLFLSSQIGIAGSLIGAAVSSIVATVSSQVYKRFLSVSAEKIKDIRPDDKGGIDELERMSREAVEHARSSEVSSEITRRIETAPSDETARADVSAAKTTVIALDPDSDGRIVTPTPRIGNADEDLSPTVIKARAERARKKRVQTAAVAVAAVSALVAVAVSAALINFVTAGEGVGTKTQPIIPALSGGSTVESAKQDDASSPSSKDGSAQGASSQAPDANGTGLEQDQSSSGGSSAESGSSASGSGSSGSGEANSGSSSSGSGNSSVSGGTAAGGSSSDGGSTEGSGSGSISGSEGSSSDSGTAEGDGSAQSGVGSAGSQGSSSSGSDASGLSSSSVETSEG